MLQGQTVLEVFRLQRNMWLGGRYGSYKTALSVRLCYEFLERGWSEYLICNFPCVLATDPRRLPDLRKTFIILDEGGSGNWLNEKTYGQTTDFLRKRDLYVCIPSYSKPVLGARNLTGQMTMDGHGLGRDFVRYQFRLKDMEVNERMGLTWYRTSEVYGLYDTRHMAFDSGGLLTYIMGVFKADGRGRQFEVNPNDSSLTEKYRWEKELGELSDHSALSPGSGLQDLEEQRRIAEHFVEGAQAASEVVPLRKYRRKPS